MGFENERQLLRRHKIGYKINVLITDKLYKLSMLMLMVYRPRPAIIIIPEARSMQPNPLVTLLNFSLTHLSMMRHSVFRITVIIKTTSDLVFYWKQ